MYLDISNLFLFCLISLVVGAVIMLIVQYYIFLRFFKLNSDEVDAANQDGNKNSKFNMPEALLDGLNSQAADDKTSQMKSVNFVLQFLFFELRSSNQVRKWFMRKLSAELDELLTKTTIGKFFSKLSISELNLGSQFPEIKSLDVSSIELHATEGHIENLDILMNLNYKGDFLLKIDADMVLGKKGSLSLRVKQLTGKARLQFTRKPFTHWSISFVNEPLVDLAIESQIQGRTMQSNVTSLISTAVKKAIRRKHTLPNYKLRFKPFFNRLIYDDIDLPIEASGPFEVTIRNLARLEYPSHITQVYATLTLSRYDWVTATQLDDQNLTISMNIEIHKAKNQQIGIVFKQTEQVIIIESILPNTPAAVAKIKRGDVLISIEGKRLNHINQVAKLLKSLNKSVLMLRVERVVPGVLRNDALSEDFADVYEDFNTVNISFSKNSESVQIGSESKPNVSLKDKPKDASSNESSINSTPSNSPRKLAVVNAKSLSNNETPKKTPASNSHNENPNHFPQHSTVDCSISDFVRMEDTTQFNLNSSHLFLNINVFGRSMKSDNLLLGFLNIPIDNVLAECSESNLNYIEKFMLNPPEVPELSNHPMSTQSGFCSSICFGDVSIEFAWNQEAAKDSSKEKLEETKSSTRLPTQGSQEKLDADFEVSKKHDFIRTHFNRSTHCDFCGKKIWLKDAVQCKDCSMSCHKKCMVKSQSSTVCAGTNDGKENDDPQNAQPEFKVTTAEGDDDDYELADEAVDSYKLAGHRQSFSDLLAQGIKRVNSANNLNIPTIVSSLTQTNSKSLPPTPQHTPRKQSLIAQSSNPFIIVVQKLEQIPLEKKEMSCDEIKNLVEPLECWGTLDDLMELAKSSSESLYAESDTEERLHKINLLLSKLRVALDCETSYQHNNKTKLQSPSKQESAFSYDKSIIGGQSEERIQILSVIMLHLCSGLQSAQSNM